MSDEEYSEEEVEEEIEEEVEEVAKPPPPKPAAPADDVNDELLTEAEKAMLAAKKRQDEEDLAKLQDYEKQRAVEREKEEEELRLLKEKQEQRRMQREAEEREMAERRKAEEERRRQEEEDRKARIEEDRKKKEAEKLKRQQMVGAPFAPPTAGGGRNFVIPEKKDRGDKFGNIVQAKQEMGMTKEQQEEQKRAYIETVMRQIDFSSLSGTELKNKIKELHHKICKLEADKYDLEKRHERLEYDLKELNERQRQVARNKALQKGLDPGDTGNSRYPPKVSISSKYDRQIDRRNFKERRAMFDKKDAYPCFPNIPPPPVILEYKLKHSESQAGDEANEQEATVDEEEEYEDEE
ncbi:Troponin T, skeletal muscle [Aphelenchoides besseyi]|nr:Troponin T, skeletal muscle [Aphelenchoides besseyi]KAI6235822.1 Troponin T, skeletal muscle [Aphelenchoides besseyi]